MNHRHAEVLASTDFGAAATEIIDVSVVDPISRLSVVFKPVGGSVAPVAVPVSGITKLELVDGSDVLYSLSGYEGQALNIFESPKVQTNWIYWKIGGTPYVILNMDFGRYLWDEALAFDPTKFKNPQLKLTHNEKAWDASCGDHSFQIYAHVFDQKAISPIGFLMNKEVKSYVGVAGGYEYTALPLDYPLRKLMIQAWRAQHTMRNVVEDIKLSEDNDKRVPIDGDIYDLRAFLDPLVGECTDLIFGNVLTTGRRFFCTPGQFYDVQATPEAATNAVYVTGQAGNTFMAVIATADGDAYFRVRGKNPHNCVCIPFGKQDVIEDWYDLSGLGSLKLRINGGGGAASGATRICTQQLRKY